MNEEKKTALSADDLSYQGRGEVARASSLGVFIGLAVIIPGISGSAVAIVLKLYEKLLFAIGELTRHPQRAIRFLLPIAAGCVIGLIAGFFGVRTLLRLLPFAVIALFSGLLLGSIPAVTDEIRGEKITPLRVLLFLLGIALPILIALLPGEGGGPLLSVNDPSPLTLLLLLLVGAVVALTQLVPGLSAGAFFMMLGIFSPLMDSVSLTFWKENPKILLTYASLAVGLILGLLFLSKLLTYLLGRARQGVFFTVCGLSLGSFFSMYLGGEAREVYASWQAGGALRDILIGIPLFAVGVLAAYLFVKKERQKSLSSREE